jgi:hypothetical protein
MGIERNKIMMKNEINMMMEIESRNEIMMVIRIKSKERNYKDDGNRK